MLVELSNYDSSPLQDILKAWSRVKPVDYRDQSLISKEYDKDKYGILSGSQTWEELLERKWKNYSKGLYWVSVGGDIVLMTLREGCAYFDEKVFLPIMRQQNGVFCELGCGVGQNLRWFGQAAYGGEICPNGVKIANALGCRVYPFDFYDKSSYQFIEMGTTIFTVQAIEQLPTALPFIEGLRTVKDRLFNIVHFETTAHKGRVGILGGLQNVYVQWNKYNDDLVTLLASQADIELLEVRYDVLGLNPLLPIHVIVWKFK